MQRPYQKYLYYDAFPDELKFHGLENLIDHYKNNVLCDNGLVLTQYIKGCQPPHETRRSGRTTNLLHRYLLQSKKCT